MARLRGDRQAFGHPGTTPRWARGQKDGVGTAYSSDSRIWFTLWNGIVTEVYYPTIDRPQLRDLQFLVTDGESFFHEEKRHLRSETQRLGEHLLGYRITSTDPQGRYALTKEIIADPHQPCILTRAQITGDAELLPKLHLSVLCAPHLDVGGWGNNAYVMEVAGREILVAEKHGTWLALAATVPFRHASCGYVGYSDGWTDLAQNFQLDWEFDLALNGNVALTGELDLGSEYELTLGLAFGSSLNSAVTILLQALSIPFEDHLQRYAEQWERPYRKLLPLQKSAGDGGELYYSSYALLLAHEDKTYPGAFIASLSIPWGEAKGDEDTGGYHLVWTRDMVNSAMGLLAAGDQETPLRALVYLAASQQADGGFPQNFWIDGVPYWRGIQLDQVAFPILLARRLLEDGALKGFDPYPMVLRAASYLIREGPATQQERWEEASGYSPSTLAVSIAALLGASEFARNRGELNTVRLLEEYADFLEGHLEDWTATTQSTLVPGIPRHYIRIHPVAMNNIQPNEDSSSGTLVIANQPPGSPFEFPAKEIVDAGFLELVRYGIRPPDDPLIVGSLRVIDALLKVDTPYGPCWHRYNHDGYGQREDGGPFEGWGTGRAWPLLTGERGHYELAAGHDSSPFLGALEQFAAPAGLLPEQVWDGPDLPKAYMFLGRSTGAARPLMWAHAEYIKLLRSTADGQVFDLVASCVSRYQGARSTRPRMEVWKSNRQVQTVGQGWTLQIQAPTAFELHWTTDQWQTTADTASSPTALGIHFVDIDIPLNQPAPIQFTFLWKETSSWAGQDYEVMVTPSTE